MRKIEHETDPYTDVFPGGWYDGATWGFATGPPPGSAWAFELIAVDGASLDWKLYCAAPIPVETYQEAVRAGGPLWPMHGMDQHPAVSRIADQLLGLWATAAPPTQVILTWRLDKAPERSTTLVTPEHHAALAELLGGRRFADQDPVEDIGRVILSRDAFLGYCSCFFGPVHLRDLDAKD